MDLQNILTSRRALSVILIGWTSVMVGVGSLTYLHTDLQAYLIATQLFYQSESIYTNPQTVYPPLFYAILAVLFFPVDSYGSVHDVTLMTPVSVGLIKVVVVGAVTAFVAIGLSQMDAEEDRRWWLLVTLLNPFLLVVTVIFGQADSLVALGLLVGVVGWQNDRVSLAGAGFAFAAAIKLYPLLAFVPLVWHYSSRIAEMGAGALPIGVVTGGLFLTQMPTAAHAFLDRSHPFGLHESSANPLSIAYLPKIIFGTDSSTTGLFLASVAVAVAWSLWGRFRIDEVRPLVAIAPAIYVYGYNPSYRWLPFVICAAYLGIRHAGEPGRVLRRYAVGLSVLGIVPLLLAIGSRNLMGKPLVHTTRGTLSTAGPTAIGELIVANRLALSIVVMLIHTALGVWTFYHLTSTPPRFDFRT